MRHPLLTLAAALLPCAAAAHDTWFERQPDGRLLLGTGHQFPLRETGIGAEYLAVQGCTGGALQVVDEGEQALTLQPPSAAGSCWVQLAPFEITLAPDKIEAYLHEVRPPAAVLQAWQAMQARGLPWKERYVKHARIALGDASAPAPIGLDIVMPTQGRFQVLREGRPLPGFNVEFRHERSGFGLWRTTAADGTVAFKAPLPGRWVLRGVDLRPAPEGGFDSRFVTLAFEVQNGMNLRSNTRSASQAPATAAISSEPPSSTPRR